MKRIVHTIVGLILASMVLFLWASFNTIGSYRPGTAPPTPWNIIEKRPVKAISIWLLVLGGYLLTRFVYKRMRLRESITRGLCPNCAYDLRAAVNGVCPECGQSRVITVREGAADRSSTAAYDAGA